MSLVRFTQAVSNTRKGAVRDLPKHDAAYLVHAGYAAYVAEETPTSAEQPAVDPMDDVTDADIRDWATSFPGVKISAKGRIAKATREAYRHYHFEV
jgi:hypothetical protein